MTPAQADALGVEVSQALHNAGVVGYSVDIVDDGGAWPAAVVIFEAPRTLVARLTELAEAAEGWGSVTCPTPEQVINAVVEQLAADGVAHGQLSTWHHQGITEAVMRLLGHPYRRPS